MEYFWGSVKLMFIVWGLAALISLVVAGIIKLTFFVIRRKSSRSQAPAGAAAAPVSNRPKTSA